MLKPIISAAPKKRRIIPNRSKLTLDVRGECVFANPPFVKIAPANVNAADAARTTALTRKAVNELEDAARITAKNRPARPIPCNTKPFLA